MKELNEAFNQYINEVKKLKTNEKRDEVLKSVKHLIASIDSLAKLDGVELEYLKSAELDDLKDNNLSEDDFLEATLVYVEEAKCLLGQYLSYKNI